MRCSCGAPATANGRECAQHFRERLRSIRLDTSATPTRSRHGYFDKSNLDETFGEDRVDRYWDETEGQGALDRDPRSPTGFSHQPKGQERQVASAELIDSYLGPETADVV